jgi:hypothetical protein
MFDDWAKKRPVLQDPDQAWCFSHRIGAWRAFEADFVVRDAPRWTHT